MISAHDKMSFLKDLNAQFPERDREYKVIYLDSLRDGHLNEWWRLNEIVEYKYRFGGLPSKKEVIYTHHDEPIEKILELQDECNAWAMFLSDLIDQEKRGASGPAPRADMIGGVI